MKELSIEEKAKAYDEAFKEASVAHKDEDRHLKATLERIFPELKESEDEKIRKWLISQLKIKSDDTNSDLNIMIDKAISWLEKKGESDETKAKTFLINKGYPIDANGTFPTYEEMYDIIKEGLEKQGEQKPQGKSALEAINEEKVDNADKVEPKFKIGDFVRSKYNKAVVLRIEEVCNDIYKTERGGYIRIEFQDDWELMEEKSAWSEEDKAVLDALIRTLEGEEDIYVAPYLAVKCLKSLKDKVQPQSTLKPSDEQIKVLVEVLIFAANHESPHWNDYIFGILKNLTRQLMKLREE